MQICLKFCKFKKQGDRSMGFSPQAKLLALLLMLALMLTSCSPATPANSVSSSEPAPVSPAEEKPEENQAPATEQNDSPSAERRDATGSNGVVSSAHPLASQIGLEVLKAGGNAIDAAVAVSFALGLVEPNASGIGGCGYLLYAPANGEPVFLDYRSTAPAGLDCDAFMKLSVTERKDTILGAGVPGAVAGWLTALEEYGTMSLEELLEPIIALAEEGFEVTEHFEGMIVENYSKLAADDTCSALYLNEGIPYMAGEVIKNPDYAQTLRILQKEGRDGFYKGEIAQSIVESVQAKGGVITLEDLANYTVRRAKPVKTTYRGYTILSSAPSSSGGTAIALCLNLLERYDLASMGQNTPETLHLLAEAFKITNVDRYQYLGDPEFVDIPLDVLLSKEYADQRAALISPDKILEDLNPGVIPYESPSTTHISIVDKDGNLVAVTNTLGTFFGCGIGVAGRGFLLDNQMYDFSVEDWEANFPRPGKRPRSSMSPTIIYTPDGEPYAALGSPGGEAIVTTMVQIISNILDHGMSVQDAIDAPRIYQNYSGNLVVEGHLNDDVSAELENMGHPMEQKNAYNSFFGGVQGIIKNQDGSWTGGADPRRDGKALAY